MTNPPADPPIARQLPPGFEDPRVGGFVGNLGPIYRTERGDQVVSGFFVEQRHCNPSDICHGGWLSTFADVAMVRQAGCGGGRWVTTGLAVDFLRSVPLGSWVESDCAIPSRSSRTCVVQGVARTDGEPVLRMNATFRKVEG